MKKLRKCEYPENIACLAIGCPVCPLCPKGYKYQECKFFSWKQENRNKYQLEVADGKIRKVYEI